MSGHAQTGLLRERFGTPDALTAGADRLVEGRDREWPQLRPILDAGVSAKGAVGPVTVRARKISVSPVTPRRTFAVVRPGTRSRVDLGRWLDGVAPSGGLAIPAGGPGNAGITLRAASPSPPTSTRRCGALSGAPTWPAAAPRPAHGDGRSAIV